MPTNSVTLTGTAPNGASVSVSDGGSTALGTTTANAAGGWSFTSADLSAGAYAFTATDTTAAGTSAKSSPLDVTVPLPAAPAISNGAVNANNSVTLTGTAPNGASVSVSDGGSTALGTTTANAAGGWSFTSADLSAGAYAFTATDTTAAGTSAKSSPLDVTVPLPAAPAISNGAVNANNSVTLTGTAPNGASVSVSDGGSTALGTTTANAAGGWSFTSADLSAGAYAFTATDTTAAGTSAKSSPLDVTVPLPAAPAISNGAVNANDSVTLTGTAPNGASVSVSDGGSTALGTTTANAAGGWSFTSADLSAGAYAFTATDTTAAGTSAKSSPLDVTVPLPAAPAISNGAVNANDSVTLTGTAPNGASVSVSDGGSTALGTTTANAAGGWSFTSADLSAGAYAFTATDTTAAGTSAKSSPLDVTVPLPAAPAISNGAVNANNSVTLTGTAPNGASVSVSDGGSTALGTTTANAAGGWSFTSADLSAGAYAFTATDTTAAGTSAKSSPLDVTVPLPAAPAISPDVVHNSNGSVTLTGTAPDGATVTVWSAAKTEDGTTTASSSGAWSFTTADLSPGVYVFTATDTTSAGTSAASSPHRVIVPTATTTVTSNSTLAVPAASTVAQSFSANGNTYGGETNLSATSDELDLTASGLTVTRGSGTESLQAGSATFPFGSDYRSTETIQAQPGDHFVFDPHFGNETIQGFTASGSDVDTLQLSVSSFSYLNAGMSQAADLAAVLLHSTSGMSATTITDSLGDTLTLAGLSSSTISADAASNHSLFKFV